MKQILFAAALLLATSAFSQTTQGEYNYVTRGYIDVVTRSLDVKNGYRVQFVFMGNQSSGVFNKHQFKFSHFINKATNKVQATIVEYYLNGGLNKILCIPLPYSSAYMINDYFTNVQALGIFQASTLARDVSEMYMSRYENRALMDSVKGY